MVQFRHRQDPQPGPHRYGSPLSADAAAAVDGVRRRGRGGVRPPERRRAHRPGRRDRSSCPPRAVRRTVSPSWSRTSSTVETGRFSIGEVLRLDVLDIDGAEHSSCAPAAASRTYRIATLRPDPVGHRPHDNPSLPGRAAACGPRWRVPGPGPRSRMPSGGWRRSTATALLACCATAVRDQYPDPAWTLRRFRPPGAAGRLSRRSAAVASGRASSRGRQPEPVSQRRRAFAA